MRFLARWLTSPKTQIYLQESQDENPDPLTSSSNLLSLLKLPYLFCLPLINRVITKVHIICSSKSLKILLTLRVLFSYNSPIKREQELLLPSYTQRDKSKAITWLAQDKAETHKIKILLILFQGQRNGMSISKSLPRVQCLSLVTETTYTYYTVSRVHGPCVPFLCAFHLHSLRYQCLLWSKA